MSNNSERIVAELAELRHNTSPFVAPEQLGGAAGVRFPYRIEDGSRVGETVTLALAMRQDEGDWPEVAPHWLYVSPPDPVLEELVKGSRSPGAIQTFQRADGLDLMAISAPPSDFWDQIDIPNGKNMETYLNRHIRRIWSAR